MQLLLPESGFFLPLAPAVTASMAAEAREHRALHRVQEFVGCLTRISRTSFPMEYLARGCPPSTRSAPLRSSLW